MNRLSSARSIKVISPPFVHSFPFIGRSAVKNKITSLGLASANQLYDTYLDRSRGKGNSEARDIATNLLGQEVWWSWDRTLPFPQGKTTLLILS